MKSIWFWVALIIFILILWWLGQGCSTPAVTPAVCDTFYISINDSILISDTSDVFRDILRDMGSRYQLMYDSGYAKGWYECERGR